MPAALPRFLRSYTGRLLLGTMLIHAALIPLLFTGILHIAAREYQAQFVNHARAQSFLLAVNLNQVADGGNLAQLTDELVLSGQVAYADFVAGSGKTYSSVYNAKEDSFQEDFFFGGHGDHLYYIAVPLRSGAGGILRVGFDEMPVEEQVRNSYRVGILLALGYVAATLTLIGFLGKRLSKSIRHLQEASRRIASGHIEERLVVDTGVTEIADLAQDLESMRRELIHREHEIARREARQRAVLETAAEGIITITPEGRIESFNKAAEQLFGYRGEEVAGAPFDLLIPAHAAKFYGPGGQPGVCSGAEVAGRRKDGADFHLMLSVSEAVSANSRCFTVLVQDISERLAYEARLAHMATHDALTKLPNRALYLDRLSQVLAHAARDEHVAALLFIDLDRFKNINDTLGHGAGDELLVAAAERLGRCLRREDTLARLGGDEFTLILPALHRADNAAVVADNILRELEKPVVIAGKEVFVSCSIGIAFYPFDGLDAGELAKNADTAMYAAKKLGGHCYQFYSEAMNAKASTRLELESGLRHALERGELTLHYQPQVETGSLRIVGVEALLRWQHPELGMVSPADFIPLAEETGMIVPISEWVLEQACRQGRAWQDEGMEVMVGVNLSARHFSQPSLFATIRSVLRETGFRPGLLDLEMTEGMVMQHGQDTIAILQRLKNLGVSLSLDDFGTGYSSLAYLHRFPIDTLKIDRAFIKVIGEGAGEGALATAIIAMARSLRMRVIAEGVETAEQLRFLREHQCGAFQGYLFSKPLPAEAVTALLCKNLNPEPGVGALCLGSRPLT